MNVSAAIFGLLGQLATISMADIDMSPFFGMSYFTSFGFGSCALAVQASMAESVVSGV